MCFSAGASFAASVFLFGAFILGKKITKGANFGRLAYMPLFFALQQAAEGIIWLAGPTQTMLSNFAAYLFLFFALIWWPSWLPGMVASLERIRVRRHMLYFLTILGVVIALTGIYSLYLGVSAQLVGCHVSYLFNIHPELFQYTDIYKAAYLLTTTLPFFISSLPKMWTVGLSIIIAYGFSTWWYHEHLISIWCFFAAIISCLVLYVLYKNTKQP